MCGFVRSCWTTLINSWSNRDIYEKFQSKWKVDFETNGKLKEEIIDWKAKAVNKICIIVNVGLDILGNAFIADSKQ